LHGNGFWNSGALDRVSATPLPQASQVTFGAPGTFTYYCLIHPFMKGTVVVQ
jgi:plastocyanin